MSSPLALASVTAVLQSLIRGALADIVSITTSNTVTARAPDRIALGDTGFVGINVYFYSAAPNAGWRNVGLPSRDARGQRLTNPPLALDLHYLLTAYAVDDLHAEILLGHAMQRLHEVPVFERDTIRTILAGLPVPLDRLAGSGLADQVEQIRFSPESMNAEAISKLWSAFQASYRPTMAYVASVVLIEAEEATRRPLPVLTRGEPDPDTGEERGIIAVPGLLPPFPMMSSIRPPLSQLVAQVGDDLRLTGHHLEGTDHRVVFSHNRFEDVRHELTPEAGNIAAAGITVEIPDDAPADWPAGHYTVHITLTQDGRDLTTNTLPLAVAPTLQNLPLTVGLNDPPDTFEVTIQPDLRPGQSVSLIVGQREVYPAEEVTAPTGTLRFAKAGAEAGEFPARLRVDGVESVFIDRTTPSPSFIASQEIEFVS